MSYDQEFDKEIGCYVFVDTRTVDRRINKPLFYREAAENSRVQRSVSRLQAIIRKLQARKIVLNKKREVRRFQGSSHNHAYSPFVLTYIHYWFVPDTSQVFSKHYDLDSGMAYYQDKRTGLTMWNKPYGMGADDIDYAPEDSILSEKDEEIRRLKAALGRSRTPFALVGVEA